MNFVGKVLIVAHFVLSICFVGFAGAVYTTQTNWKSKHDDVKADLGLVNSNLLAVQTELKTHKDDSTAKLQAANNRANDAEGDLANEQREHTRLDNLLDDERTKSTDAIALAEIRGREADERRREANIQRSANQELKAAMDSRFTDIQNLENDVFKLKNDAKKTAKKHKLLLTRVGQYRLILREASIDADPDTYVSKGTPPPLKTNGLVLTAKSSKNKGTDFIEISLGSDDGISKDHVLYVSRKSKYLGKIKIVFVTPDASVGTVIQDAKNGTIKRGDHVTAKLL